MRSFLQKLKLRDSAGPMLFLSHAWGRDALGRDNHARVRLLSRALNRHGVDTWLDEDRLLGGNIEARIARGIEASVAVLVCVTRTYCAKVERACLPGARHDYCASEWHYARLRRKPLIPVLMEPLADWPPGVVGMHMWPLQYADFSGFPGGKVRRRAPGDADDASEAARQLMQFFHPRPILWF